MPVKRGTRNVNDGMLRKKRAINKQKNNREGRGKKEEGRDFDIPREFRGKKLKGGNQGAHVQKVGASVKTKSENVLGFKTYI